MGMFLIEKGTEVQGIKDGKEWYPQNFCKKPLEKSMVFDKSELSKDPTGISRDAIGPNGVTVGASWAKAGYYGFKYKGWTILVRGDKVKYG